jgi:predicted TPR repeat methyltransferase
MTADRPGAARRVDMALALAADGEFAAAQDAAAQACALDPGWPDAWFVLAECAERNGDVAAANRAYRECLACDSTDRLGAGARLALLGAAPMPDRLPAAHVKTLFDETAARFEESLIDRLDYRAPQLLADAIRPHLDHLPSPRTVIDLGCGTGLAGAQVRAWATRLDGIDLSPAMIAEAARKQVYDSLRIADLLAADDIAHRYALAIAADVLCYLGDLAPAFAAIAARLVPGGYLAFTVEEGQGEPFRLGPAQRYRHDPAALRSWLAAAGFDVVSAQRATLRLERRAPVAGLVIVARKTA